MENYKKLILQFIKSLEDKGIDASMLKDNDFDDKQKHVLYRALVNRASLESIAYPELSAYEMEDILDHELDMTKNLHLQYDIDPKLYDLKQLYELNDALAKGCDISKYRLPEFSAEQMHFAKTIQCGEHPETKFVLIDRYTGEIQGVNTNADVLGYFKQYDANDQIAKWRESGKIETSETFHFLAEENPERLTLVLNDQFHTDVTVEELNLQRGNVELAGKYNEMEL
jgi:hypothetical protein